VSTQRFTPEFKEEAVKQVTERGYSVAEVAARLGIPTTAHGLRALASTTLHEAGIESAVIEAALAHVGPNKTRAAYNRAEYITQRRQMLEWQAERIQCSSANHA